MKPEELQFIVAQRNSAFEKELRNAIATEIEYQYQRAKRITDSIEKKGRDLKNYAEVIFQALSELSDNYELVVKEETCEKKVGTSVDSHEEPFSEIIDYNQSLNFLEPYMTEEKKYIEYTNTDAYITYKEPGFFYKIEFYKDITAYGSSKPYYMQVTGTYFTDLYVEGREYKNQKTIHTKIMEGIAEKKANDEAERKMSLKKVEVLKKYTEMFPDAKVEEDSYRARLTLYFPNGTQATIDYGLGYESLRSYRLNIDKLSTEERLRFISNL